MSKPVYFRAWITHWDWGVRIALFLILASSLMQFGLFALTQNYMISYLGAQPEDISFAFLITYGGITAILPVQFRFLRYFETRDYLLANILLGILLNLACIRCRNIDLFIALRVLQGILIGNINIGVLILILSRLDTHRAKTEAPAVFYGTLLANTTLIGVVAASVVDSTEWKATYYYVIGLQLVTLALILLMLRPKAGHRRYPLYQIDWAGFIIYSVAAWSLGYTVIYGGKYYWFEDPRIRLSAAAAAAGAFLFLYRQMIVRRPSIHLGVFKSPGFVTGLCLLVIYYGSKDSINLIYTYAGAALKWRPIQVVSLAVCNLSAMVVFLIIATKLILAHKGWINNFLILGFAAMGVFNIWMSYLLTPDLSFTDLLFPVLLQGAASGILFVPIILFILSHAPANTGFTGLILAAYTRFIATINSVAGFYSLQLYWNQKYKEGFLAALTTENPNTVERLGVWRSVYAAKGFPAEQAAALANAALSQSITQQTQLLTNRTIYMLFGVAMLAISGIIFIGKIIQSWKVQSLQNLS
jgi:DHA2 family multidrug resistance protein